MGKNSPDSPIWVVGDYPSFMDKQRGGALRDAAGDLFWAGIEAAGFDPEDIHSRTVLPISPRDTYKELYKSSLFCTKTQYIAKGFIPFGDKYVAPIAAKPFQILLADIKKYKPMLIIGLGELTLFCLSGNSGIMNWRGSCLSIFESKFIPTVAPAKVMKMWKWKYFMNQDLRRAFAESHSRDWDFPKEDFSIYPTFQEVRIFLGMLTLKAKHQPNRTFHLGVDIETRTRHLACIAIASTPIRAMCIPILSVEKTSYWETEQEAEIIIMLRDLLTQPNVECHGQNFLYDMQYIARYWGFIPNLGLDTMTAWHTCFPGLPQALSFICSMILPKYSYWKEEGKGHDPTLENEPGYFIYNCKDAARTLQLIEPLERTITSLGLEEQVKEQMAGILPRLRMMMRGVKRDVKLTGPMAHQLLELITEREIYFEAFTEALTNGEPLAKTKTAKPWYRSPTQQQTLFYQRLGLPTQRNRKNFNRPTCDDKALDKLKVKEPLFAPLFSALQEYRSLGVFLSTFVKVDLDWDNRMRCSYGAGMAETFRDTSSEDVFGFGGNLQNIPQGNRKGD